MATAATHVKLGLFTLLGFVSVVLSAFALGAHHFRDESTDYYVYFDESVQGLAVGAPVKFRGVSIGRVKEIGIAPDGRHVQVIASLSQQELATVGLIGKDAPPRLTVHSDLRAQLTNQGITGVKLVNLDFFNETKFPPPALPFEPPKNTIPTAVSLLRGLEDSLSDTMAAIPQITNAIAMTLTTIESFLSILEQEQVPHKVASAMDNANGAVTELRGILKQVDQAKLPTRAATTLNEMFAAVQKVTKILERVNGKDGLLDSTQRATDALSEFGRGAAGTSDDLDTALRDLSEAAQAVRDLAESLERDPDMLLKGRSQPRNK